jgi:adenosine deaminase
MLTHNATYQFIKNLPKAELHVHFDGTIEPDHLLMLAERNKIRLPYSSPEAVRQAWHFNTMQEFCAIYDATTSVLRKEQDFYDVMWSYLERIAQEGVKHVEVFFDTQTYTARGIRAGSIVNPLYEALQEGNKKWGITGGLILCFLRHLSEQDAFVALRNVEPYRDNIIAVGLASDERNNPPSKFMRVFAQARDQGYHCVAHAGEHAGPSSIRQALDLLQIERIDHGVRCWEDPHLVQELIARRIPLTMCPLSNIALQIYPSLSVYPLKQLFDAGLIISLNSDDPAYFGGYITDNYWAAHTECGLTIEDLTACAKNSFTSAFIDRELKDTYVRMVQDYVVAHSIRSKT